MPISDNYILDMNTTKTYLLIAKYSSLDGGRATADSSEHTRLFTNHAEMSQQIGGVERN